MLISFDNYKEFWVSHVWWSTRRQMKITKHMVPVSVRFFCTCNICYFFISVNCVISNEFFPFFPVTHEIQNKPRYMNHQIKNGIDSKNKQPNVHYYNFFFFCFVATALSYRKAQKILRKEHFRILFNQIQYNYMDAKIVNWKMIIVLFVLFICGCCCWM